MKTLHQQVRDLHDELERRRERYREDVVLLNSRGHSSKDAITMSRLYADLIDTLLPYLDK